MVIVLTKAATSLAVKCQWAEHCLKSPILLLQIRLTLVLYSKCRSGSRYGSYVITYISSLSQAVLGKNGLFEGLSEGNIWIDHTTSSYEQTIELTTEASRRGFRPVEGPITGGMSDLI